MTDKNKDSEFLADLLVAASKLLAQRAVEIRFQEFGTGPTSNTVIGTLNAAVRCQLLAEHYRGKPS